MKNQTLKTAILAITALVATFSQATNIRFCDTATATGLTNNSAFKAKGKIGNSANCSPCGTEQFLSSYGKTSKKNNTWKNGVPKGFEVAYTASTRTIKFTLDCEVLSYNLKPGKQLFDLIIKTQANFCGASVKLNGLSFNNGALAKLESRDKNISSFRVNSQNLESNWSLKGTATMGWARNTTPTCNNLNFTVSGTECVPEPASMTALAIGAIAILRRRKNSK